MISCDMTPPLPALAQHMSPGSARGRFGVIATIQKAQRRDAKATNPKQTNMNKYVVRSGKPPESSS
jgi:hypothetical protein